VAEPTGAAPILGHKGAMWLTGRSRGAAAHGSRPEAGVNAVYKAARAIARLADHQMRFPPHPLLGPSTVSLGTIAGGVKPNVVPAACRFSLDVRTLPGQGRDEVLAELGGVLGSEVELAVDYESPALVTPEQSPLAAEVFAVMEELTGRRPEPAGASYFTDGPALARGLAQCGEPVPVVLMGPGSMAHQADEVCPVADIELVARAYQALCRRWLGLAGGAEAA